MSKWSVEILNPSLGGFAPAYYKETYPSYGNNNQAASMLNIDCTNPGYIQSGSDGDALTNGTQAAAVTTLIKGIMDRAVTSDTTYAVGGAKLYKFSSTAVTNAGAWPHTIDKAAVTAEDGEDVVDYQGNLYYSYNHSGTVGDIGKYDLNVTFDDDWGSTVPTGMGVLVGGVPHQLTVGGNDVLYIANGRYIASYDGTTLQTQALDLPTGYVVASIKWVSDRLWISANSNSLTGTNRIQSSIFVWDGTTDSWETEIKINGRVGSLYVKNSSLYVFYQDISDSGAYKLAIVSGISLSDICSYSGSLPSYYQVTEYKDFIVWGYADRIFAWGSGNKDLPPRMFQFTEYYLSVVAGGLAAPFGALISASNNGASYILSKSATVYTNEASWKSLMFDVTGNGIQSSVNVVRFNFEKLVAGGGVGTQRIDWKILDANGRTVYTDIISYTKLGGVSSAVYKLNGLKIESFRLELSWASGERTENPIRIRNIKIYGTIN